MISAVRYSPTRRLVVAGLNPQPLPPKSFDFSRAGSLAPRMWSQFDQFLLNPQPLPPRDSSRYQKVGLNPQPLPPKVYAEVAMTPLPPPPRDPVPSLLNARVLSVLR
jgi:hypothetical protein